MQRNTHLFVMDKTIEFLNIKELKRFKKTLKEGVIRPDKYDVTISHFYNPKKNTGLWPFSNAKSHGTKLYKKAVRYYKKGKKKDAFYTLGESLHFIMDLAIPAHSIPENHFLDCDDLENFLELHFKEFKFKTKSIVKKKKVKQFFIDIAKKSQKLKTKHRSFWGGIKFILFHNLETLDEKTLKKEANIVLPLALMFCAGLVTRFFEDVKKH